MLGIFAVVLCACVVVASVLGMVVVLPCGCVAVAGSVVFERPSLLFGSVGLAVGSP